MPAQPHVAIACGGTGGHYFPGIAVAHELIAANATVTLFISEKDIDKRAAEKNTDLTHIPLPAIGLHWCHPFKFIAGYRASAKKVRQQFAKTQPQAILAMGGFTSAAPVRVGRAMGAATLLHESNAIPGRANRLLARWADEILVGLDEARNRFSHQNVHLTGTPARTQFREKNTIKARTRLGFDPNESLILVIGGSQGARGLNRLVAAALPGIPETQWMHLAGPNDFDAMKTAHRKSKLKTEIHEFYNDMPTALAAADLVISRAGASSIAELAATGRPSVLVPLPGSADDHQRANARAAAAKGGAVVFEQTESADAFSKLVGELLSDAEKRQSMSETMGAADRPEAAEEIARRVLAACEKATVDTGA